VHPSRSIRLRRWPGLSTLFLTPGTAVPSSLTAYRFWGPLDLPVEPASPLAFGNISSIIVDPPCRRLLPSVPLCSWRFLSGGSSASPKGGRCYFLLIRWRGLWRLSSFPPVCVNWRKACLRGCPLWPRAWPLLAWSRWFCPWSLRCCFPCFTLPPAFRCLCWGPLCFSPFHVIAPKSLAFCHSIFTALLQKDLCSCWKIVLEWSLSHCLKMNLRWRCCLYCIRFGYQGCWERGMR
jgi:hypothetical protein